MMNFHSPLFAVDPCADHACLNDGACEPIMGEPVGPLYYTCQCPATHQGDFCEDEGISCSRCGVYSAVFLVRYRRICLDCLQCAILFYTCLTNNRLGSPAEKGVVKYIL